MQFFFFIRFFQLVIMSLKEVLLRVCVMYVLIVSFGVKMGQFLVNMGKNSKMRISNFFYTICLLKETSPKFLKILQETNFDMDFQKINIRDR